jgi:hypothetical protein
VFSSRFVAAAIAVFVLFNAAGAHDEIGQQFSSALVGGVLVGAGAGVVLGIVGFRLDVSGNPDSNMPGLAGSLIGAAGGIALGYPAGCAMGTAMVGSWQERDGNTGLAYAGAYLGLPVGIGLILLGAPQKTGLKIPLCVLGGLAPPAGAVIGYNLTKKERQAMPFGARVSPPTLAFHIRPGPDRQRYSIFDCRLVTVGF